jgi:hypothetical protein
VLLGAMLEDATPPERTEFLKLIPAPVRFIYKTVGQGIHRRAIAKVRN